MICNENLNCFQNVILDVCSLDQELTLLQQGCDVTGGNYLKVPQLAGLLQYLLVNYLFNFVTIDINMTIMYTRIYFYLS